MPDALAGSALAATLRDPAEHAAPGTPAPATAVAVSSANATATAEARGSVIDQIVANVRSTAAGTIEIRLSPEELGHVRLEIRMTDGGLTVRIDADRAETLDLMRRSADLLAREFREAGFSSANLSFGSGASHRDDRPEDGTVLAGKDSARAEAAPQEMAARRQLADRLDIRL